MERERRPPTQVELRATALLRGVLLAPQSAAPRRTLAAFQAQLVEEALLASGSPGLFAAIVVCLVASGFAEVLARSRAARRVLSCTGPAWITLLEDAARRRPVAADLLASAVLAASSNAEVAFVYCFGAASRAYVGMTAPQADQSPVLPQRLRAHFRELARRGRQLCSHRRRYAPFR